MKLSRHRQNMSRRSVCGTRRTCAGCGMRRLKRSWQKAVTEPCALNGYAERSKERTVQPFAGSWDSPGESHVLVVVHRASVVQEFFFSFKKSTTWIASRAQSWPRGVFMGDFQSHPLRG